MKRATSKSGSTEPGENGENEKSIIIKPCIKKLVCSSTRTEKNTKLPPIINMGIRMNHHCGVRRSLHNSTIIESGLLRVHAPLTYLVKDITDLGKL